MTECDLLSYLIFIAAKNTSQVLQYECYLHTQEPTAKLRKHIAQHNVCIMCPEFELSSQNVQGLHFLTKWILSNPLNTDSLSECSV